MLRLHESVGVVGVACPDESPLLSFISLMAPAFVRGNVTVMIPSEKYPLPALELYQVKIKFQFYFFLKITLCDIFSSILTCFLMQQHIILISWASIKHQPQSFTHNWIIFCYYLKCNCLIRIEKSANRLILSQALKHFPKQNLSSKTLTDFCFVMKLSWKSIFRRFKVTSGLVF